MKCACLSSHTNMDIPKNKEKPSHFRHVFYVGRDGREGMDVIGTEEERIIHHKIAVNGKESEITITLPKQSGLQRSASMQQVPSLQQVPVQQKSSILQRSVSFQQGSPQRGNSHQECHMENSSLQAKQKKSARKSGKFISIGIPCVVFWSLVDIQPLLIHSPTLSTLQSLKLLQPRLYCRSRKKANRK